MDLMNEAEKLYKDLQNRYHDNYATMYTFVSKCCGDMGEAGETGERQELEETYEWVKR